MASPRLGYTELTEGQAVPETTVNEMCRFLEQGIVRLIVKDKDLATPPGSPADGDAYIVASSPTGAWTGHAKAIAFYMNTSWNFIAPIEGTKAYLQDQDGDIFFDGTNWLNSRVQAQDGVGYATGSGGTVTQATSKTTGVTLSTMAGQITMNNAALASNAIVTFTVTNTLINGTDLVIVNAKSGFATAGTYRAWAEGIASGSYKINVQNVSGGSLSEAVVLSVAVFRGVTS